MEILEYYIGQIIEVDKEKYIIVGLDPSSLHPNLQHPRWKVLVRHLKTNAVMDLYELQRNIKSVPDIIRGQTR
jgi:hypothetical protein